MVAEASLALSAAQFSEGANRDLDWALCWGSEGRSGLCRGRNCLQTVAGNLKVHWEFS